MTTPTSAAANGQPSQKVWAQFSPYVNPPIAAMAAIVLVFPGFVAKTALQVEMPIPPTSVRKWIIGGSKAAPTLGMQMIIQGFVERAIMNSSKDHKTSFATMFASSGVVALASAFPLAVFNNQTMGKTFRQSVKAFSAKQAVAIVPRELSFLLSIRVSSPLSAYMKQRYGESKAVDYGSAFTSGAIGSIIGHPFDTALSLWQKEMKVENFRQLMIGSRMKALAIPVKALANGAFSVCYKAANELLESASK